MEPPDNRDPFDPEFYEGPTENNQGIGMLMLRAFCVDFFETSIRSNTNKPDNEHLVSFLVLIKHAPSHFERARAVIPELQAPDPESSHPNHNVQVFLNATRGMRGPPGKKWDLLPEEPTWTRLAKVGMENLAKQYVDYSKRHQKRLSYASVLGSSVNPTMRAPGNVEHKASDSPSHLPTSVEKKSKSPPKKLDLANIPTFVPRNPHDTELSRELVWSPTSGTRPRRQNEFFHQTEPGPVTPLQSGQGFPPNATSAYSLTFQNPIYISQGFFDSPPMPDSRSEFIRRSSPSQSNSTQLLRSVENHRRHDRPGEISFPHGLNQMMEMTTLGHVAHSRDSSSSHPDNNAYPATNFSGTDSPSQARNPRYPSSQARELFGAEPFSAPPSIPGYGNLHQTGQGMHGGPPSPFQSQPLHSLARSSIPLQDQLPHSTFRPATGLPHVLTGELPHVPNPELWTYPPSRPHFGGSQNQPPNQIIQPVPQRMIQSQIPPFMTQGPPGPSNDELVVPPPGSMPPVDYWNMLHQRGIDICTRLRRANRDMTPREQEYMHRLSEARVDAVASKLPFRGNMVKSKWLAELNRILRDVWKEGPDARPDFFDPVVVARKQDFVKAIEKEIAFVESTEGPVRGAGRDRWHAAFAENRLRPW